MLRLSKKPVIPRAHPKGTCFAAQRARGNPSPRARRRGTPLASLCEGGVKTECFDGGRDGRMWASAPTHGFPAFFRRRRCPRSEASTLGVHRPARCTNAFPLLPRRGGRLCPPLHPSIGGKARFKTQRRVSRIALPSAAFLSQFVLLSAVSAASFCSTMRSGVTPAFSASSFVITTGSAVSSTSLAMIQ